MKITPRVALELAHHEALVRQAYKDSVGVWTWGIGITSASGHDVERYIGKPQSFEHCIKIYGWALERYAADVRETFRGHDLTEAQFAAALSFHYNTGAIRRATWVKQWKSGDVKSAHTSFMAWKKPAAIIERRKAERDLFFDGVWHNRGTIPEYTRVKSNGQPDWSSRVEIEAAGVFEKVLGKTKRENPAQTRTMKGAATTAVGQMVNQGTDQVNEIVAALPDDSGYLTLIKSIGLALTVIGIGVVIYARLDDWKGGHR